MIERAWTFVSLILLLLAAFMLWRNNLSTAFVIATLGIVVWFLSYRTHLRAKITADEASKSDEPTDED